MSPIAEAGEGWKRPEASDDGVVLVRKTGAWTELRARVDPDLSWFDAGLLVSHDDMEAESDDARAAVLFMREWWASMASRAPKTTKRDAK